MVLIDSIYINDGGGLVLLKHLVNTLKKTNKEVIYLFDNRTRDIFENDIGLDEKYFISNSVKSRFRFYLKNKNTFKTVLCFGNVPPPIRLNAKTIVYFHQPLFLNIPKEFSLKRKFVYNMKQIILSIFKNNADVWLVQSNYIKKEFSNKYLNNQFEKIAKLPFYPEIDFSGTLVERNKAGFLYISNSSPHKNHKKLIEAFCLAYDNAKIGHLTITVPQNDENLCSLIIKKYDLGYPIYNVGFLPREKLVELYLSHEYLIFPSLAESFGLGLAEAIDGGCKIIASDLPYTYEICEPSSVFNPLDIQSIKFAILKGMQKNLPASKKLVHNDISKLIDLLAD